MILAVTMLAVVLVFAMVRPNGWPEAVAAVPSGPGLIGVNVGPNLNYLGSRVVGG